jgi:trehalose-phosphatase
MVNRGNETPLLLSDSASNQFQSIKYKIKNSDTVVILSDFDGTLSPIVDVPSEAEILDEISLKLRQLQSSPRCYLGIVSGRSVEDLQSRVPVQNIALAGNHGIEIKMRGESYIHGSSAEKETAIQKAVREIQREISSLDGVKIDNKLYTATIHYRNVQEDHKRQNIRQVITAIGKKYSDISVQYAKKAYEIWPQTKWSKADAVERLLEKWDLAKKAFKSYISEMIVQMSLFSLKSIPEGLVFTSV